MIYHIVHESEYTYASSAEQSYNTTRLKPISNNCQKRHHFKLAVDPSATITEYTDFWGNNVIKCHIADKHTKLRIAAESIVLIQRSSLISKVRELEIKDLHTQLEGSHRQHDDFLKQTSATFLREDQLKQVLSAVNHQQNPIEFALQVMAYFYHEIVYEKGVTSVLTNAQEAFDLKRCVCQDKAHMMIGVLRACHIPSRYVSGYLYTGEENQNVDPHASHAWVEFFIPRIGWIGLDPTNNSETLESHIRVSVGRDYTDVSPIKGVYTGGSHSLDVHVSVKRINGTQLDELS